MSFVNVTFDINASSVDDYALLGESIHILQFVNVSVLLNISFGGALFGLA